ncbi:hypothetical protein LPJ55_005309 [Coemansia sp. RSA 990]|nr:hypothetical protein LPJ55_005309 [Coemansia sp. RSA 990]
MQTPSDSRRTSDDQRTNKVESLLQKQAPGDAATAHKDHLHSNSPLYINDPQKQQQQQKQQPKAGPASQPGSQQASVPASPYMQRQPFAAAEGPGADAGGPGQSGRPSNHASSQLSPVQGQFRRTRQHAATISEPMGPQSGMHRPSRVLVSPQQGQQQSSFRYFQQPQHAYASQQQQQQQHPPPPRTATAPGYDTRPPPQMAASPQDSRPRRLSFMGPTLSTDGHREQYETSFSRSTSTAGPHYPGSAQPSPHGAYFPGGPPYPSRQPPYPQQQQQPMPPPSSAPAHQQHFGPPHPQPQGSYGPRHSYGSLPVSGMAGQQRSLSPPPPGRRHHLPVPGRFDAQRSPLPFPRISSPSMQQQQEQTAHMQSISATAASSAALSAAAAAAATAGTTSQSPARESTRRLSSVVWGPTGFERLESGMSRCRICGKEYSKGSSTGTLKRHFRQHQVNVGTTASFSRPSPPPATTAAAPVHHGARPRAYSHRTETRTRREMSPFSAGSRLQPLPIMAAVPEPKAEPVLPRSRRTDSLGDIDSNSVIAGSALLSMAAGDAHMDGDGARRPARSSDPSVYPQTISAAGPAEDPDTRDISVSPSPSSSSLGQRRNSQGGRSDDMDVDDGLSSVGHRHKRRRATVTGMPRLSTQTELSHELGSLTATQLVALSSELVRRVAGALPALALEAGQTGVPDKDGGSGDALDMLFRHVKGALVNQSSGTINGQHAHGESPHPFSLLSSFSVLPREPQLPFTIRKQVPIPSHTNISVESLSLSEMSLLSRVSACMQRIAPLSLAEREWDNVGTLLEAAKPREGANKVFLTIDLTPKVLDEALEDPSVGVIVAYHPPIFFAWKSLKMSDLKQSLVLKCAAAGVSIYSPHTSLDSCRGGINDWLASLVGEGSVRPIVPATAENAAGQENVGSGRIIELAQPQPFGSVVDAVKRQLGLDHIRVARAACHSGTENKLVSSVAICAGSGGSVVGPATADVYLTGEMDHHSVLAAVAKNTSCILAEHSNTERGYLRAILVKRLQEELDADAIDAPASIVVSEHDRDPITIE